MKQLTLLLSLFAFIAPASQLAYADDFATNILVGSAVGIAVGATLSDRHHRSESVTVVRQPVYVERHRHYASPRQQVQYNRHERRRDYFNRYQRFERHDRYRDRRHYINGPTRDNSHSHFVEQRRRYY